MATVMPGWSPVLERSFKEVLYRFMEEVHCTKAALFLLAPTGDYVLMTQYGFGRRDLLAAEVRHDDPMVAKVRELRTTPRAFNDPHAIPDIAPYLEGAGTARLLLVPLYASSRVVGFVDARDKGRRRVFEPDDLLQARRIARTLLDLVQTAGFLPEAEPEAESEVVQVEPVSLVEEGKPPPSHLPVLDEAGLSRLQAAADRTLRRAAVATVALTIVDGGVATTAAIRAGTGDLDLEPVQRHQAAALRDRGLPAPGHEQWSMRIRSVPGLSVTPGKLSIATAVLLQQHDWFLVASVIGVETANAAAEALADLHGVATHAHAGSGHRFNVRMLARRLLRPGEKRYDHLEAHSTTVSRLCWALAAAAGLPGATVEHAALAGLLHDVGMRELDYDTLYRHAAPGPAERRRYTEHVLIGEKLLAGIALDPVVSAVRHHHERWDGRGYPDRLAAESIPLLARIVHAAEVFDVLTSQTSYRRPVSRDRALRIMRGASGQFDPEILDRLEDVV